MEESSGYGHLPYQPFRLEENPTYILPDLRMKEELPEGKDPLYQPLKLESSIEILPIIPEKEDLLAIKEEPDIDHDLMVTGEDSDECNTDIKNMNLRYGSEEDPMSLCEVETECNNTDVHTIASPYSVMQLSLNVKPSPLPDCKIPSVHQYSRDTVRKKMSKKNRTSLTVEDTEMQMRHYGTIKRKKAIVQNGNYNSSEKTSKSNENKINICDTCHKCFSTPSNLKTHIKIHTQSKPYTCDTCHNSFSRLAHLQRHIRIHIGNKPYTCDTCHKCFSDSSVLKKHIRIHTGSKPYTCETCHKCFRRLADLKIHKRIHTGSKPYTCDICHKCFSDCSYFKKHIRIHTGSKPYSCANCRKSFSQLSNLKRHANTHRDQTIQL